MSENSTRSQIARLLADGTSQAEIGRALGLSAATVSYHARRLGLPARPREVYDWVAIQAFHDAGHTLAECMDEFGFARSTWTDAVRAGHLRPRSNVISLEQFLSRPRSRNAIKRRLIAMGVKRDACEGCGISEWRGRPLSLDLHHVNGIRDDNRLENLKLLCPNCHRQTDTFGGRNRLRPSGGVDG